MLTNFSVPCYIFQKSYKVPPLVLADTDHFVLKFSVGMLCKTNYPVDLTSKDYQQSVKLSLQLYGRQ